MASELPRDRSTLLVRLMAGGSMLPAAIQDLGALPAAAHEHAVASQILLGLRHALGSKPHQTTEEQEFIVNLQAIAEKLLENARKQGRKQGQKQGGRAHARATLRRVLAMRRLAPDRAEEAQIDACDDIGTLDRWIDQALTARNASEALR